MAWAAYCSSECGIGTPPGDRMSQARSKRQDKQITNRVNVPVIASGGVGNLQQLAEGVLEGGVDAVLAASIFHFGEYTVQEAKEYMAAQGIAMRL